MAQRVLFIAAEWGKADHVDAALQHVGGEVFGALSVSDHHWDDGVPAWNELEAEFGHVRAESLRVVPEPGAVAG